VRGRAGCWLSRDVASATTLIALGRITEATDHIERANSLYPSDARPVQLMVKTFAISGDIERANDRLKQLRKMAEADPPGPTNARRQYILAISYLAAAPGTPAFPNDIDTVVRQMKIMPGSPDISRTIAEL